MAVPFDGIKSKLAIFPSPWAGLAPAQGDAVCRRLFLEGTGKVGEAGA